MLVSQVMRLAIVEDEPQLLEKLCILLGGEKDWEVVGAFSSAEEAIAGLKEISPDIILVDLGLPCMTGAELIAEVKCKFPAIDCIAFTGYEDRETVLAAIRAGASGYILKGSTPRKLIESLQEVREGGAPMSPRIARAVVAELQSETTGHHFILSEREREILRGAEDGLRYKEIAQRLSISHHTVHTHIKNIYDKLQAKGRKDALLKARRKGII